MAYFFARKGATNTRPVRLSTIAVSLVNNINPLMLWRLNKNTALHYGCFNDRLGVGYYWYYYADAAHSVSRLIQYKLIADDHQQTLRYCLQCCHGQYIPINACGLGFISHNCYVLTIRYVKRNEKQLMPPHSGARFNATLTSPRVVYYDHKTTQFKGYSNWNPVVYNATLVEKSQIWSTSEEA